MPKAAAREAKAVAPKAAGNSPKALGPTVSCSPSQATRPAPARARRAARRLAAQEMTATEAPAYMRKRKVGHWPSEAAIGGTMPFRTSDKYVW